MLKLNFIIIIGFALAEFIVFFNDRYRILHNVNQKSSLTNYQSIIIISMNHEKCFFFILQKKKRLPIKYEITIVTL